MQKPRFQLDKKIAKICFYRGITLIIALAAVMALYLNRGFFTHIWEIIIAVLRPIVIGGMFAYLLAPIARRMEAAFSKDGTKKWARPASVALSYLILALFVLGPLALILLALYKNFDAVSVSGIKEFFELFKTGVGDLTDTLIEKLGAFGISEDKLKETAAAFMGSAKTAGSALLFGIIFSVYFLLDRGNIGEYWLRAYNLITGGKHRDKAKLFLSDADRVFSGYFRGQFIDMLIIGTIVSISLLIAGVPNGVLIGVLTGIGNLIPYCGTIVGYGSLILMCLPSGNWEKLIIGAIVMGVALFVDGNIINPRLLSSNIKVHPLLVVAALLAGGAIGGVVGMIVAVPVAALLKIQFDRYLDKKEKTEITEEGSKES